MSEFTSGNLVLNKHFTKVAGYNPKYHKEVNDKWCVFYMEGDHESDITNISKEVPILYFYNFEDHGWGYSIIHDCKKISAFDFSYEKEEIDLQNYVQEKFPDEDAIELLYIKPNAREFREQMLEQYYEGVNKEQFFRELFNGIEADSFRLFELSDQQIMGIKEQLSANTLLKLKSKHDLVENFKTIVGIQEMSWIRSDRFL